MLSDIERQKTRRSIKENVLNRDAAAVVRQARELLASPAKAADVMFCASTFAGIAEDLKDQLGARRLRTYVVRSVTVEPILPYLTTEAVFSNYLLDAQVGGYGSYADEMLNADSALGKYKPDLVLVLLDLGDLAGRLPELCADGIG